MSEPATGARSLGDIDPARSRHAGRRSAVALTAEHIIVGTATGAVLAFDRHALDGEWTVESDDDGAAVVSAGVVGDVSLLEDGILLTSHGDYRGYRLRAGGSVDWCVDLATARQIGGQKLYAYPNHVTATEDGVVFVTGNTYAAESRETDTLHPEEHTVFGYGLSGSRRWTDRIGGFASGVGEDGGRASIPSAQHFRQRDPDGHGFSVFDIRSGAQTLFETDGVVTATALDGETAVAVEEPVSYHDDEKILGGYRLHRKRIS